MLFLVSGQLKLNTSKLNTHMRFSVASLCFTLLFIASAEYSSAQVPLRTFSVTTEKPEESYTIEFVYMYKPSPKGYTDVEFLLQSTGSDLYVWSSDFQVSWNPKSIKFHSFRHDEHSQLASLSKSAPQYGLEILTDFKKKDSFVSVHATPVEPDSRTQLGLLYYLGTVRFKDVNSKLSNGFNFNPLYTRFYSSSGLDVTDQIVYEFQEYQYEEE